MLSQQLNASVIRVFRAKIQTSNKMAVLLLLLLVVAVSGQEEGLECVIDDPQIAECCRRQLQPGQYPVSVCEGRGCVCVCVCVCVSLTPRFRGSTVSSQWWTRSRSLYLAATSQVGWRCPATRLPGSRAAARSMTRASVSSHNLSGADTCEPHTPVDTQFIMVSHCVVESFEGVSP